MPNPSLRDDFFDESVPGPNDLSASEYNLNAQRTDTAFDNAVRALNRANHSGTQTAATISDLTEVVHDIVAQLLVEGSNINLSYDDNAGQLTITASGGQGGSGANLSMQLTATTVRINSDTGTDVTIAAADDTNAGIMTKAMYDKLTGIANNATANSSDATLLSRVNHTGTQVSSTISDWTEAVQDTVGATLVQGANISISYSDVNNTITISAASGSFVLTPTTVKTASYTATASDYVQVDSSGAGSTVVVSLPSAPADGALVGVYLLNASRTVTLSRSGSDELLYDGSAIVSLPLYSTGGNYLGLTVWRYRSTGAYWYPITYNSLPRASDIIDSSPHGRAALTSVSTAAARNAFQTWLKRVNPITTASSITPDSDTMDVFAVNAQGSALTINAPAGTAGDYQPLIFRIKDNGVSRALSWNSIYHSGIGVALPAATVVNKTLYVGTVFNLNASAWDVVSVWMQA